MIRFVFIFVLCLVLYELGVCQFPLDTCDPKGTCSCENSQGIIDLHPLARNDGTPRFRDIPDPDGKTFYSWNPCYGFDEESCHDVAICQIKDHGSTCTSLGPQSSVQYVADTQYGLLFRYTKWGGANNSGHVIITCDPQEDAVLSRRPDGDYLNNNFFLELKSKYACPAKVNRSTTPPPSTTTGKRPITPAFIGTARTRKPTPTPTAPPTTPQPLFDINTLGGLMVAILVLLIVLIILMLVVIICLITRQSADKHGSTQGFSNRSLNS